MGSQARLSLVIRIGKGKIMLFKSMGVKTYPVGLHFPHLCPRQPRKWLFGITNEANNYKVGGRHISFQQFGISVGIKGLITIIKGNYNAFI